MMENQEYLSEERYNESKKKISGVALIILIIGLLIGGSLITLGIINMNNVNSKYSEENKEVLTTKLNNEKKNLENRIAELEAKGLTYDTFAKYTDGEKYELKILVNVLDPSFERCKFDEYKNNTTTTTYCNIKSQLEEFDSDFDKNFESTKNVPLFMLGAFIIIAFSMISFSIYTITKRREITDFATQQVMPIAQEGIEKIAPTIGKVGGELAKTMTPVYKDLAKEISKGIKEGLKDEEE